MNVELVYITADQVIFYRALQVADQANVALALSASDIYAHHPEARQLEMGIFAKRVTPETVLKEGDRIEIYRPLTKNPKERRKQQADERNRAARNRATV